MFFIPRKGETSVVPWGLGGQEGCYIEVSHSLALCLLAFLCSSGRGGMGYGYLLLDAIDPVEEVGDLAGDSVSVELERARNFFPLSFLRLPLRFPCHELLLGRPFSQMSEIFLASGILSLHEWDSPLDLKPNSEMFWEKDAKEGVKDGVQICRCDRQADLFLELQPEFVLTPGGMSL